MRRPTLAPIVALLLVSLSACLGQAPGPAGPAPAGELVTSWTDTEVGRPGTGLYLRNNTQREIVILAVALESCVGIREECREYEPAARLQPGETRRVMSIHRLHPQRAFNVDWSVEWEYVDAGDDGG